MANLGVEISEHGKGDVSIRPRVRVLTKTSLETLTPYDYFHANIQGQLFKHGLTAVLLTVRTRDVQLRFGEPMNITIPKT